MTRTRDTFTARNTALIVSRIQEALEWRRSPECAEWRKQRGIEPWGTEVFSLNELARRAPYRNISRLMTGRTGRFDSSHALRFALALEVSRDWLELGRGKMTDVDLSTLLSESLEPDNLELAARMDKRFGPSIVDMVRTKALELGFDINSRSPEGWIEPLEFEARKQLQERRAAAPPPPPPVEASPPTVRAPASTRSKRKRNAS